MSDEDGRIGPGKLLFSGAIAGKIPCGSDPGSFENCLSLPGSLFLSFFPSLSVSVSISHSLGLYDKVYIHIQKLQDK